MTIHQDLAAGRWNELTLMEQLANIGSEVGRAARARSAGNEKRLERALDRALELFDLTIADERWRGRLREAVHVVADEVVSSPESLDAWFLPFAMAARRGR